MDFFSQLYLLTDTIKPIRIESRVPTVQTDGTSMVIDEGNTNYTLSE